ncbi:MAG: hypothetical protein ACLFUL_12520 [Desulfobacteraceae bacterium]
MIFHKQVNRPLSSPKYFSVEIVGFGFQGKSEPLREAFREIGQSEKMIDVVGRASGFLKGHFCNTHICPRIQGLIYDAFLKKNVSAGRDVSQFFKTLYNRAQNQGDRKVMGRSVPSVADVERRFDASLGVYRMTGGYGGLNYTCLGGKGYH